MSVSSPFALSNARLAAFGSRDEYLSYRAVWQALTRARVPLSPTLYAAHAILSGRDLYKAFSASQRPGDEGQPYRAVLVALDSLAAMRRAGRVFLKPAGLTEQQLAVLHRAVLSAADLARGIDLSSSSSRLGILQGRGAWTVEKASAAAVGA